MKGTRKSRGGCLVCKRRKKKCDELKPQCSNCSRLKLPCKYGLVINWDRVELRTVSVVRSRRFPILEFVNYNPWQLEMAISIQNGTKFRWIRDRSPILTPASPAEFVECSKTSEKYIFNHYISNISATLVFHGKHTSNEFYSIVVPQCERFAALFQIVLSYAAIDLAKMELVKPNPDINLAKSFYKLYLSHKDQAYNELHLTLDTSDISELETIEELIITIMLLCSSEATNNTQKNWSSILKEGCLVFSSLTFSQIINSDVLVFAYKQFSLRYILLVSTLKGNTLTRFLEETQWPNIDAVYNSDNVDHLFGCSPRLLHTIYKLAMLNHLRDSDSIDESLLMARYLEIWKALLETVQVSTADNPHLGLCAEIYLVSAKLYLCMLLSLGDLPLTREFNQHIPDLMHDLIDKLEDLSKIHLKMFHPMWGILILAACQTGGPESDEFRFRILSLISVNESRWPLSNYIQLRDIIMALWATYDFCVEDPEHSRGVIISGPRSTDWRDVVCNSDFWLLLV
ncbi:hypothetical protein OGAPHI_000550 [Ogataea philodendri]|uniref:Zn(2)-C6 fungal-type domain-containing protein n=1 Tax=Ogataea philodendri TaxID=1378263 RepID=A0A9P8PFX9_9ASCO|nr:uncharacterized protein OGAPHI_000550 [Ogataea philodendri]KAH3671327.1 hypothetical protein OGAPHI_000550 [Ogataea philodendri]